MIDALTNALGNPAQALVLLIEFLLGVGLGYVAVKALKYLVAFLGIIVLGLLLNVWSLGLSLSDIVANFGSYISEAKDLALKVMGVLGLLTLGPATLGLVVGAIIAWLRR